VPVPLIPPNSQRQLRDWYALKTAGDAFYQAERYREAEKAYTEALEQLDRPQRVPKEDKDWRKLVAAGDSFLATKFYPDAKAAYERVLELVKSAKAVPPKLPLTIQEKLKQAEDGLPALKESLEVAKGNAWAWVQCEGFYESIKNLTAEEQWRRIQAKTEELDGAKTPWMPTIENGTLTGVWTNYSANVPWTYLQPLYGMPLRSVNCRYSKVSDLTPLRRMPLTSLTCCFSRVSDSMADAHVAGS
jgi:tetratricopeptide (TPR) repeat protein